MTKIKIHEVVGNEFVLTPRRLHPAAAVGISMPAVPIVPAATNESVRDMELNTPVADQVHRRPFRYLIEQFHRHSLLVFAALLLIVGTTGIEVGGSYYSAHLLNNIQPVVAVPAIKTIAGLNLTVAAGDLQAKLASITNQSASITIGAQAVPIPSATIQSWIQVTPSADKSQDYLRIKAGTINTSLQSIVNQYVKAPVNQVTSTENGAPVVILAGSNGVKLTDPSGLTQQAANAAKSVMNGTGISFNAPTESQGFASLTPANFPKLLVANVTTKTLYAYQNGQLVNTFLTTDGAPATPTPLGEFQIWEKLTTQTMTGFNVNGTPYVQPNVPWVNYFDHSGDAVHGNYWRPASVFGNINTSHGCVGVPVSQAEWIYDWAPIGTTVITHA